MDLDVHRVEMAIDGTQAGHALASRHARLGVRSL